jgi:hypothetical protein
MLPADGIIENKWEKLNKDLPRVSFSDENRMRRQYRWPEADFEHRGKCPALDKSVSTYLNTKLGGGGKFKPRSLFPSENKAEKALEGVDKIMRCQQRIISHLSYMLAALKQALLADSQTSEEDIASLLGALVTSTCDMASLTTTALAKCVQERRHIYVDAMNLPDKSDREALLKVPMEGSELFGGKFNDIAKESSQLRRDAKEMASTMASTAGGSTRNPATAVKRRFPSAAQGQFKRFRNLAPHEERCLPPPGDSAWIPFMDTANKGGQQKPQQQQKPYQYQRGRQFSQRGRGSRAGRQPFPYNKQ